MFLEFVTNLLLRKAMGLYQLCIRYLEEQEPRCTLYLAVPIHAYESIFSMPVREMVLNRLNIQLIIYSVSDEEEL